MISVEKSHSIEDFIHLINPVLKRFSYYPYEYDELYQLGLIAIDTALKRFDNTKGVINNFVIKYVIFEIKNYFKNKNPYDLQNEFDNYYHEDDNDYKYLRDEIKKLDMIERKVIFLKYYTLSTQQQISEKLNISQPTVSRIEKQALQKLRYYLT